jgi:hypothetical protein
MLIKKPTGIKQCEGCKWDFEVNTEWATEHGVDYMNQYLSLNDPCWSCTRIKPESHSSENYTDNYERVIKVLFLDIKTGGYCENVDYNNHWSAIENPQPILWIGWGVREYPYDVNLIGEFDPDGIEIFQTYIKYDETQSSRFQKPHRIALEHQKGMGCAIHCVLPSLIDDIELATKVVGHHIEFDINIVLYELYQMFTKMKNNRLNPSRVETMLKRKKLCLGKKSVELIPFYYYSDIPSLDSIYYNCFNEYKEEDECYYNSDDENLKIKDKIFHGLVKQCYVNNNNLRPFGFKNKILSLPK